jgi:hypothetical protein
MKSTTIALVVLASILAGCGSGGGSSTGATTTTSVPAATAAHQGREAEAVCAKMVNNATRLGKKAFAIDPSRYASSLEFTTEALIAPSLPVVEGSARELRAIIITGAEPKLGAFVNLFDPILALLQDRVRAGRQGNSEEAHEVEQQLIELGQIQRTLAKEAGLKSCDVDFVGAFSSQPAK